MVNQVNSSNQQTGTLSKTKQQQVDIKKDNTTSLQTAQAPSLKAASDSVSLTPQALKLKSLQDKAQESPGFDSAKVAELKKAISEGNYQIDAEKLAKNLADFELNVYG